MAGLDVVLAFTCQIINVVLFFCLCYLAASQNNATAGWEAKLVEFFKDKLQLKDAQTSVVESRGTLGRVLDAGAVVEL